MEGLIADLFLVGNTERVVLIAAETSTQMTGSVEQKATPTTWRVLRAFPVKGNCPREKSLRWWMKESCVACTTTACWTT